MADSLLLDGQIELIAGPDRDTSQPGWFLLVDDYDLGEGAPDVSTVTGSLLDGDVLSSFRFGNRSLTLTIVVVGSDRTDLADRVDQVRQICAQSAFTLVCTPDGGLTYVIDCLGPAAPDRVRTDSERDTLLTVLRVTCAALPFARSQDPSQIALAAGSAAQIQLDGMNSGTFTNATEDTSRHWEGAGSAQVGLNRLRVISGAREIDAYTIDNVTRLLPGGATDLTGYAAFGVRLRWPAPYGFWRVAVTASLSSGGVVVAAGTRTINLRAGDGRWRLLTFPIDPDWDVSAIDRWRVDIATNYITAPSGVSRPDPSTAWLDDLRAYPLVSAENSTTEGAELTVPAVSGSARTPVNLTFTGA